MHPPGFDCGPVGTGPPLRASPESLDFARDPEPVVRRAHHPEPRRGVEGQGAKHRIEVCQQARACWQTVTNESEAFMNIPG